MSIDTKEKGKITPKTKNGLEWGIIFVDAIFVFGTYLILPYLINMPLFAMNWTFQLEVFGFNFGEVFLGIFIVILLFQLLVYKALYKDIDGYLYRYFDNRLLRTEKNEKKYDEYILKIRSSCINVPYVYFFVEAVISFFAVMVVGTIMILFGNGIFNGADTYTIVSTVSYIVAIWLLINVAVMICMQSYNLKVLRSTYRPDEEEFPRIGKRISSSNAIIIQLLPVVFGLLIIFSELAYVRGVQLKRDTLYAYYKMSLSNIDYKEVGVNQESLLGRLNLVKTLQNGDVAFVITPDDESYTTGIGVKIDPFVLKYRDYFFGKSQSQSDIVNLTEIDDILYEGYGIDVQLYCRRIYDEYDRPWYVGYRFNTADSESGMYYLVEVLALFIVYSVLMIVWARTQATSEKEIAQNMEEILLNDDFSKGKYIPILSSDETGDIAYFYNKIQYRMVRQQDIMVKQEQLSVLGEMAGGMAHDINTPISAINTAINMLGKRHGSDERDMQILENMQVSTDRIISIVTSMRNQVRNMGSNQKEAFPLNTMLNDILVITANEQKKCGCTINIDVVDDITIYGERTKLGQVLTNLAVNGLQAYVGNGIKGVVTIRALKQPGDRCIIEVEDHAGGIPEKVQPYIFNNIMTTKGAKGTGLGLYLASTVIKGVYEGTINFVTKVGDGTTFIIDIPLNSDMINSNNNGQ